MLIISKFPPETTLPQKPEKILDTVLTIPILIPASYFSTPTGPSLIPWARATLWYQHFPYGLSHTSLHANYDIAARHP